EGDYRAKLVKIPNAKKYIAQTSGLVAGGPDEYNANSFMIYCDIDELRSTLEREFRGRTIPGQPVQKNGKPYKQMFYSQINVYVDKMENVTAVQEMINSMGYNTYASAEWIEQSMQEMNIVQTVLGAIGAVSLFVAAIGITNTMMMSIYERTKEIGIMKVIGCRLRDIQALFLIEAGYIGFLGGALGVVLSYGLSVIANKLISQSEMGISKISVIPPWLALLSIVFAVGIGMFSGLLPSFRAMRLSPLAAIRNE
ncbi:MAG: ABC transporter permease, partial [Lachnospiraceae bacterium]